MSDVTVSPSGGGAPSAAPSSSQTSQGSANPSEVVVNQNPTHTPNPVGPQTPTVSTEHKGSEHRTQSRREALQEAFRRAESPPSKSSKPSERPAPKAAEAKPGHNQPPEETPKLDLKKRPDDQPKPEEQPRDRGRFAPRQPEGNAEGLRSQQDATNQAGNVAQGEQTQYKPLQPHEPYAAPPARMGERAKRDWAGTPESVRGDIHRVQAEFAKAYTYYKEDYEAFKPIKKFHQLAQQQGTTLDKALDSYVSIENKLRADPIAGLDTIVNNLGLTDPQTGQRIGLRDIAYYVLNQSPEQLKMVQQGNQQQAAAHQIGDLHREVRGLKDTLNQMHTQQQQEKQFAYTRSAVDQFAGTHPRIDETAFGEVVKTEIGLGFDLETAYRRAELLLPATQAAQTRTTPAQTRPTDRSIHGAPGVAPSDGASRRPKEASPTARAAFQNAFARMNGAH